MLSGRREGRRGLRESDKERQREGEREINYLSLNAKQRNQMSRGEGELHIVSPPFFHRSIVIMSKEEGTGGGEERSEIIQMQSLLAQLGFRWQARVNYTQ